MGAQQWMAGTPGELMKGTSQFYHKRHPIPVESKADINQPVKATIREAILHHQALNE